MYEIYGPEGVLEIDRWMMTAWIVVMYVTRRLVRVGRADRDGDKEPDDDGVDSTTVYHTADSFEIGAIHASILRLCAPFHFLRDIPFLSSVDG